MAEGGTTASVSGEEFASEDEPRLEEPMASLSSSHHAQQQQQQQPSTDSTLSLDERLPAVHGWITERLELRDGLLDFLLSRGVLGTQQRARIRAIRDQRGAESAREMFAAMFCQSGQSGLSVLLEGLQAKGVGSPELAPAFSDILHGRTSGPAARTPSTLRLSAAAVHSVRERLLSQDHSFKSTIALRTSLFRSGLLTLDELQKAIQYPSSLPAIMLSKADDELTGFLAHLRDVGGTWKHTVDAILAECERDDVEESDHGEGNSQGQDETDQPSKAYMNGSQGLQFGGRIGYKDHMNLMRAGQLSEEVINLETKKGILIGEIRSYEVQLQDVVEELSFKTHHQAVDTPIAGREQASRSIPKSATPSRGVGTGDDPFAPKPAFVIGEGDGDPNESGAVPFQSLPQQPRTPSMPAGSGADHGGDVTANTSSARRRKSKLPRRSSSTGTLGRADGQSPKAPGDSQWPESGSSEDPHTQSSPPSYQPMETSNPWESNSYRKVHADLIRRMDPGEVRSVCYGRSLITHQELDGLAATESNKGRMNHNEMLLSMLTARGPTAYEKFVSALQTGLGETHQLFDILLILQGKPTGDSQWTESGSSKDPHTPSSPPSYRPMETSNPWDSTGYRDVYGDLIRCMDPGSVRRICYAKSLITDQELEVLAATESSRGRMSHNEMLLSMLTVHGPTAYEKFVAALQTCLGETHQLFDILPILQGKPTDGCGSDDSLSEKNEEGGKVPIYAGVLMRAGEEVMKSDTNVPGKAEQFAQPTAVLSKASLGAGSSSAAAAGRELIDASDLAGAVSFSGAVKKLASVQNSGSQLLRQLAVELAPNVQLVVNLLELNLKQHRDLANPIGRDALIRRNAELEAEVTVLETNMAGVEEDHARLVVELRNQEPRWQHVNKEILELLGYLKEQILKSEKLTDAQQAFQQIEFIKKEFEKHQDFLSEDLAEEISARGALQTRCKVLEETVRLTKEEATNQVEATKQEKRQLLAHLRNVENDRVFRSSSSQGNAYLLSSLDASPVQAAFKTYMIREDAKMAELRDRIKELEGHEGSHQQLLDELKLTMEKCARLAAELDSVKASEVASRDSLKIATEARIAMEVKINDVVEASEKKLADMQSSLKESELMCGGLEEKLAEQDLVVQQLVGDKKELTAQQAESKKRTAELSSQLESTAEKRIGLEQTCAQLLQERDALMEKAEEKGRAFRWALENWSKEVRNRLHGEETGKSKGVTLYKKVLGLGPAGTSTMDTQLAKGHDEESAASTVHTDQTPGSSGSSSVTPRSMSQSAFEFFTPAAARPHNLEPSRSLSSMPVLRSQMPPAGSALPTSTALSPGQDQLLSSPTTPASPLLPRISQRQHQGLTLDIGVHGADSSLARANPSFPSSRRSFSIPEQQQQPQRRQRVGGDGSGGGGTGDTGADGSGRRSKSPPGGGENPRQDAPAEPLLFPTTKGLSNQQSQEEPAPRLRKEVLDEREQVQRQRSQTGPVSSEPSIHNSAQSTSQSFPLSSTSPKSPDAQTLLAKAANSLSLDGSGDVQSNRSQSDDTACLQSGEFNSSVSSNASDPPTHVMSSSLLPSPQQHYPSMPLYGSAGGYSRARLVQSIDDALQGRESFQLTDYHSPTQQQQQQSVQPRPVPMPRRARPTSYPTGSDVFAHRAAEAPLHEEPGAYRSMDDIQSTPQLGAASQMSQSMVDPMTSGQTRRSFQFSSDMSASLYTSGQSPLQQQQQQQQNQPESAMSPGDHTFSGLSAGRSPGILSSMIRRQSSQDPDDFIPQSPGLMSASMPPPQQPPVHVPPSMVASVAVAPSQGGDPSGSSNLSSMWVFSTQPKSAALSPIGQSYRHGSPSASLDADLAGSVAQPHAAASAAAAATGGTTTARAASGTTASFLSKALYSSPGAGTGTDTDQQQS